VCSAALGLAVAGSEFAAESAGYAPLADTGSAEWAVVGVGSVESAEEPGAGTGCTVDSLDPDSADLVPSAVPERPRLELWLERVLTPVRNSRPEDAGTLVGSGAVVAADEPPVVPLAAPATLAPAGGVEGLVVVDVSADGYLSVPVDPATAAVDS